MGMHTCYARLTQEQRERSIRSLKLTSLGLEYLDGEQSAKQLVEEICKEGVRVQQSSHCTEQVA